MIKRLKMIKKRRLILLFLSFALLTTSLNAQSFTLNTFNVEPYVQNKEGLAVDIAKVLFQRANIGYIIKSSPQKRAIITTRQTQNNAVLFIQRSQERESHFKWVGPIFVTQTALFSLENSNIKVDVFKDVFQYPLLVTRGSADEEYLKGFGIKTQVANNDFQNVRKLKAQRAHFLVADVISASYNAKKANTNIKKRLTLITTLRSLAFNIDTSDKIIEHLNQILTIMYKDGTIKKILTSYENKFESKDISVFFE